MRKEKEPLLEFISNENEILHLGAIDYEQRN